MVESSDLLLVTFILVNHIGNCLVELNHHLVLLSLLSQCCLKFLFGFGEFSKQTLHAVVGLETVFGVAASVAGVFE